MSNKELKCPQCNKYLNGKNLIFEGRFQNEKGDPVNWHFHFVSTREYKNYLREINWVAIRVKKKNLGLRNQAGRAAERVLTWTVGLPFIIGGGLIVNTIRGQRRIKALREDVLRMRALRIKKGITTAFLAKEMNVKEDYFDKLEEGKELPTRDQEKFIKVFLRGGS